MTFSNWQVFTSTTDSSSTSIIVHVVCEGCCHLFALALPNASKLVLCRPLPLRQPTCPRPNRDPVLARVNLLELVATISLQCCNDLGVSPKAVRGRVAYMVPHRRIIAFNMVPLSPPLVVSPRNTPRPALQLLSLFVRGAGCRTTAAGVWAGAASTLAESKQPTLETCIPYGTSTLIEVFCCR